MSKTPRFDPTVNLGHILTFGGFIIAGSAAFYAVKTDVAVVGERIGRVEQQLVRVAELMVSGARQDIEIAELKRRVNKLESK